MAKSYTPTEQTVLKNIKEDLWKLPSSCENWFPTEIYRWVQQHSKRLGVPEVFISVPLLVSTCHLSMHAVVQVDKYQKEHMILYGLVGGDSGSNKSGALNHINEIIDRIRPSTKFDTGTSDGLRLAFKKNQCAVLSMNDEFSTFLENLDKTNGGIERSRVLNLYNATAWGKWTKTDGTVTIHDPRFNLVGFSQIENVIEFGQRNLTDGFFQRFLCAVPEEIFVYRKEQKEAISNCDSVIDLEAILNIAYESCKNHDVVITLSKEAHTAYDTLYDECVDFRKENRDYKDERSVVSKSKGLTLRVAGAIALLRTSMEEYLHRQVKNSGKAFTIIYCFICRSNQNDVNFQEICRNMIPN